MTSESWDPRGRILIDNPIRTIWRVSHIIGCFADPFYGEIERQHGISRLESATLLCLANVGELRAQQLVEMLVRPKNTVSGAVHSLVRKGLIRRVADPTDARRAILALTPRGKRSYEAVLPLLVRRQEQALQCLSAFEREQFEQLLGKLVDHIPDWR